MKAASHHTVEVEYCTNSSTSSEVVWSEIDHVAAGNYYGIPFGPVATPFSALKDLVDGDTGDLVTHHPGIRVSGWNAGAVKESIGVLSAAFRMHNILCLDESCNKHLPLTVFRMYSTLSLLNAELDAHEA